MEREVKEKLKRGRPGKLPEKREVKTELPLPAAVEEEIAEVGPDIYRQVGKEVLEERLEPAAWAKALADCHGSRDEALTYYVRHRAEGLQRENQQQVKRGARLEQRMVGNFCDFRTQPIVYHPVTGERGPMSLVDALFWHGVAVVGMVGCLLAVGLLWPSSGFQLSWGVAVAVVLAMQAIPILAWWFGRRSDRTLSYSRVTQMAGVIAMVASTGLGIILLANPTKSNGMALYRKEVIKQSNLVNFPSRSEPMVGQPNEKPVAAADSDS